MKIISRNKKLYLHFSHNGQMVRKSMKMEDTAKNRKLLHKQIIPEIQKQIVMGEFFKKEKITTLDEFTKKSFEMNKATRRYLTNKQYEDIYRLHIQPTFGSIELVKIKRSDFLQWQNNLTDKLAGKTVQNIRAIFMTILQDALKDEVIEKNYLSYVKTPKIKDVIIKKPFTVDEMYKIIDNSSENIKAYFAIGFFTGMRTGEIIALKWEDIDFENKLIKVRHSIRDGQYTKPKTESSIRDVEILNVLIPYLREHRKIVKNDSTFLFETYEGKPFARSDKISSHYWKKTLIAQDIEYRNLYQMRHTFASQMLMNNESILWVSKMLGHKDSSMTLQKYARYIPSNDVKRATFLER
ncbi:tyrosine-type recombinase/integrase [Sulfurimonas sp. SAG-AH-194-L11]|nr:site-specific integrase [Sulfurimonas sp. SAG-AH-194-L11]MDF1877413.1 tyrosine-type recombinase/integrase [Sulfurimonas sp. SAG-AH-194-L11]